MKDFRRLFYPRNIAFVGASENIDKWGSFLFTNIIDGGFGGKVFPVTTRKDTVFGRKAYKSVLDIEEEVDLAFISTPAKTVIKIIEECAIKRINNIVMIASGFSETGEDGKALEEKLIQIVKENGMNMVGPNTMGIINTECKLFAAGAHIRPIKGGISLISHSGNVGVQIMEWAKQENVGINKFIGVGNEATLESENFLEYLGEDEDTSVILMYMEGIKDGRRFFEIAKNISRRKPIIVFKAGRTELGNRAAASHTGAMAVSYKVLEGAMKQAGIVIAETLTEMLSLASAFDSLPFPAGNRVGIITLGGGWGVVAADECEERGLVLPALNEEIFERLDKLLPPYWSKKNPVDIVGKTDVNLFRESIASMITSDDYDAVVILGIVGSMKVGDRLYGAAKRMGAEIGVTVEEVRKAVDDIQLSGLDEIIDAMERFEKPIYPVALIITDEDETVHHREGKRYSVVIYKSPEEAIRCIEKQYNYSEYLKKRGIK